MTSSKPEAGAVFVDRDGVICESRPDHVKSWEEFRFIAGSVDALASLTRAGVRLFVFSNQGVVGRGLISRRDLDVIHERMLEVLGGSGARIESLLVCPHHPSDGCTCRKPEPGLLFEAAERFGVALDESFVVGDYVTDIQAGVRAGCDTVLVRTGRGAETERLGFADAVPTFIADDLTDAAIWILTRRAARVAERTEVTRP